MHVFFRRIHLYLGLAAGLVILIACLTGAVLVFEKDLQQATSPHRYFVKAQGVRQPLAVLADAVRDSFPAGTLTGVKVYTDPGRTVEVTIAFPKAPVAKKATSAERAPAFTIFVNPYTAEVLQKYSYRETAFYKVFALHRWLLGTDKGPGKMIVGIATLIFLFILLTGIILWWPKTRAILSGRLRVKWAGGWKRLTHDLHIVLGFYSSIFLFVIAFTGLPWSFEWFNNGIYKVTGSPLKAPPPPPSAYQAGVPPITPDRALETASTVYPRAVFFSISIPKDSTDPLLVSALPERAVHESATDAVYLDRYTGAVLQTLRYSERSAGARARSTFKPVHTGSIWGLPSKVVAFVVCLLGASFPVTGTIMWLNRKRKKKKAGQSLRRDL
ncbi:MAG: hypothetical protein JWP27_2975 [Flaviaesturariibacter sp.]|nr:hypothetical protein [Flaviaesturariibacter sp.]